MFRRINATKSGYITNKIISNDFRAIDGNSGRASTINIFHLYSESTISGTADADVHEISRGLIKFDLDKLRALTGSILDMSHTSFNARISLFSAQGDNTVPSNFKIIAYPFSRSWDEGIGRDIYSYSDIDVVNFLTASITNGVANLWRISGSGDGGIVNNSVCDFVYSHPTIGALFGEQTFSTGEEDLLINVTTIVSGTVAGFIPDEGFRLSLSGTQETDTQTRWVKRFFSRHVNSSHLKPKLLIRYNDALQDDHEQALFDVTNSIYLKNSLRGQPAHLSSGSSNITGLNSVMLRLESGSQLVFKITGSQHRIGQNFVTGVYSASFMIPSNKKSALRTEIRSAHSATFDAYWCSLDQSVTYLTSSLVVREIDRSSFDNTPKKIVVSVPNLRDQYSQTEIARIRIHALEIGDENLKSFRVPLEPKSLIFNKMYYQIRDAYSDEVIIPFDGEETGQFNATLCSTDSNGMFFDLYIEDFDTGRSYTIDIKIKSDGINRVFDNLGVKFKVVD